MTKAIVLLSGGLDSSTAAYLAASAGYELHCLSFFYGQRHKKELDAARAIARSLGAEWDIIDISSVGNLLKGSALTDMSIAVPHGQYDDESMKITVVPNRNAIMLAIAFGIAGAEGAWTVWAAMHAGDHAIYPDCRLEFVDAFQTMEDRSLSFPTNIVLRTPFIFQSKSQIVTLGAALDVPYDLTWSCYSGRDRSCGRCGTCVERLEAFAKSGIEDPLDYEDRDFWKCLKSPESRGLE